jgi:hypothetical protein
LERSCALTGAAPGFPYACEAPLGDAPMDADAPAGLTTAAGDAEEIGVRSNASSESRRYCGVCTPML